MRNKFIILFFVFFGLIFTSLLFFGEIYTDNYYKSKSLNNDIYLRYSDIEPQIKMFNLENRKIDAIVIGSSRVLSFNKELFPDNNFYNLGRTIYSVNDLDFILKKINLKELKSLYIGLDPYFFNKNFLQTYSTVHNFDDQKLLSRISFSSKQLLIDLLKFNFSEFTFKDKKIGLNYYLGKGGIDSDGSRIYINNNLKNFSDTDYRIKNFGDKFEKFEFKNIDNGSLELLTKILNNLSEVNNLKVKIFLPPISPSSIQYFIANRKSDLNLTIGDTLSQIINEKYENIEFIDLTNVSTNLKDDKYYSDAIHFSNEYAKHLFEIINLKK